MTSLTVTTSGVPRYAAAHRPLRVAVTLFTLTCSALLAAAPAHATGKTAATCVSQFSATISPGFTSVPSTGTETTGGETGSIVCVGTLAGRRITGPGSTGFDLPYSRATCAAEKGVGTVQASIPTTAGIQHIVGELSVRRTVLAIRADAQSPGMRYSGIGLALPQQGDCFLTPLRRVRIVLAGTLSGG